MTSIDIIGTGQALGAEVKGVDLRRRLSANEFAQVYRAWLEHEVLLFRDQQLSDDDLIRFSKRLGPLEHAPIQENGRRFVEGHPEIYIVSNVVEDGIALGSLGHGEAVWHTDMSYLPDPPKASALYALDTPAHGGETGFSTMTGAFAALPPEFRQRIADLRLKHDGTYNSGGYLRTGLMPNDDPLTSPGAIHPLVAIHPETGRKALYLGRRRNAYIDGLSLEDSDALLDEIWAIATRLKVAPNPVERTLEPCLCGFG